MAASNNPNPPPDANAIWGNIEKLIHSNTNIDFSSVPNIPISKDFLAYPVEKFISAKESNLAETMNSIEVVARSIANDSKSPFNEKALHLLNCFSAISQLPGWLHVENYIYNSPLYEERALAVKAGNEKIAYTMYQPWNEKSEIAVLQAKGQHLIQRLCQVVDWLLKLQQEAGKSFDAEFYFKVVTANYKWREDVSIFMKKANDSVTGILTRNPERFVELKKFILEVVKGIKWPHSVELRKAIERLGFEFAPTILKRDQCVCKTCGVEISGWQPWHNPGSFHNFAKHPPSFKLLINAIEKAYQTGDYKSLNEPIIEGKTALHLAVETGNLSLVKALTELPGIDFNSRIKAANTDLDGATPLYLASYLNSSSLAILNHLISIGADPSIETTEGISPLNISACSNKANRVNALLKSEKVSYDSATLINAVRGKNIEIINTIFAIPNFQKEFKDVNFVSFEGKTALHYAVEMGNLDLVKALVALPNADLNVRIKAPNTDLDGATPLLLASYIPETKDILTFLLEKGADPNIPTTENIDALDYAAFNKKANRVKTLLANNKFQPKNVYLINAVLGGITDVVKSILAIPGFKYLNWKNKDGESALFTAAKNGQIEIVETLLQTSNIDTEAIRNDGKTALQIAQEKKHTKIVFLIEQKKLLNEISQFINLKRLSEDTLIESPFLKRIDEKKDDKKLDDKFQIPTYSQYLDAEKLTDDSNNISNYLKQVKDTVTNYHKEKSVESFQVPTYSQYLKTERKFPSDDNFLNYLREIKDTLINYQKEKAEIAKLEKDDKSDTKKIKEKELAKKIALTITQSEKEQVKARKLWSDVVSSIAKFNADSAKDAKDPKQNTIKNQVIERLKKAGYTNNPEKILQDCIEFLKNNTAIVVTFNASFLANGANTYETLNLFEKNPNLKGGQYQIKRDNAEIQLFKNIDPKFYRDFVANIHARPRYGALIMLDRNHVIQPTFNYGKSYIVLRHKVKFNSLFCPFDSLDYFSNDLKLSSYHDLEYLLLQSKDELFKAIAERAVAGHLPPSYNQQYHDGKIEGYMEVMLPPINVLDKEFVEHIYFNTTEYKIGLDELKAIQDLGISWSQGENDLFKDYCTKLMDAVNNNNLEEVKHKVSIFPSLALITNYIGEEPIVIAAKKGSTEIAGFLTKYYPDINKLVNGKTLLHIAVETGNLALVKILAEVPGINLNVRMYSSNTSYNGATPLLLAACYPNTSDILNHLLLKKADPSIATIQGLTPLSVAAWNDKLDRVNSLIATNKTNINNIILPQSDTALTDAVAKGNVEIVKSILAVPELKILNHKNNNGVSALFIAVKENKLQIIKALLDKLDIDVTAARLPGDGKTTLQLAEEKSDWNLLKLLLLKLYQQQNPNKTLQELNAKVEAEVKPKIDAAEALARQKKFEVDLKIQATSRFLDLKKLFEQEIKDVKTNAKHEIESIIQIRFVISQLDYQDIAKKDEILLGCLISEKEELKILHNKKLLRFFSEPKLPPIIDKIQNQYLLSHLYKSLAAIEDVKKLYNDFLAANKFDAKKTAGKH